jgi:hypothetical protein
MIFMRFFLTFFAVCLIITGCRKSTGDTQSDAPGTGAGGIRATVAYPACVQNVITNGSTDYVQISQYIYNNKTVYLFTADCCDRYNYLFDDQCNRLCAPTGGFSGKGDLQCPDFVQAAVFIRVVWQR